MKGLKIEKEDKSPRNHSVVLELKGRLGNQMFRYAYMRSLWELRKNAGYEDQLILDLNDYQGKDASQGWEDSLQWFKVLPYTTVTEKKIYRDGSFLQKLLAKTFYGLGRIGAKAGRNFQLGLQNLLHPMLSGQGLNFSFDNRSYFNVFKNRDLYIDGSFENPAFFQNVREELLQEFTPKEPELPHNEDLYKVIRSTESVCISIRRGDFVENKDFKGVYDVCGKDYFLKAIQLAQRLLDHPTFIFFSDDIEWVRANIPVEGKAYYETGTDPVWEKLRLMYSCKHFIISNSTFSWWAQYLSTHPGKVVIAPDRWYRDNRPQMLLDSKFIKINTDE